MAGCLQVLPIPDSVIPASEPENTSLKLKAKS